MKRIKKKIRSSEKVTDYMTTNSKITALNIFKIENLFAHNEKDIAISNLEQLCEERPNRRYDYMLADYYNTQGKYKASLKQLSKYKDSTRKYKKLYATALQGVDEYEQAVDIWASIKVLSSLTINELIEAGVANLHIGEKHAAMRYFNEITSRDNTKQPLWTLLSRKGYLTYAADFLSQYIQSVDSSEVDNTMYFELGDIYYKCFEYNKAIENIEKAISIEPNEKYYYTLAGAYANSGDYSKAIEVLNNSGLVGAANSYNATYQLGSLYYKLGDFENCVNTFIHNEPYAEITTHEILTNKYYLSALMAEEEENYEEAIELLTKTIYSYNGHCKLLFTKLGEMYYKVGNIEKACENFLMYNISPEFPVYNLNKRGYAKDVINYSEYYERLKVEENFVLYSSFSGASFTGSPYALFKELYKQEGLIHFVLYNGEENRDPEIEKMDNVYYVRGNSKLHRRISCQAKILITNGTFPYAFMANEEQIIINTWHGTPIKYLGYDVEDASYLLSRNVRNSFITSTLLIHPNQFTMDAMTNSFKLEGASDTQIAVTGYPRQDLMLNITDERKAEIKKYLEIDETKPIVLYAPTYRDSLLVTGEQRDNEMMEAVKKLSNNTEYNFLFKGHYFDESVKNKTNDLDTNELLSVVDVLISDYSSIAIDFMAMNKPIIYFTYDLEEYRNERGFYFELDTITSSMVDTLPKLERKILEKIDNPKLDNEQIAAAEKFCNLDDGNASKRVIDLALTKREKITSGKKEILVYIGDLLTLGEKKQEFEELLNSYDQNKEEVTILLDEAILKKELDETYIDELIERGFKITFYYGNLSRNILEDAAYTMLNQNNGFVNEEHKNIINNMMNRNNKRIFGRINYDQVDIIENNNNRDIMLALEAYKERI